MICCIGAVFDFYAGTKKRPEKLWIKLGLEWLGRLFTEPGECQKDIYIMDPYSFTIYFLKGKLNMMFTLI